jgi:hypothetical protein
VYCSVAVIEQYTASCIMRVNQRCKTRIIIILQSSLRSCTVFFAICHTFQQVHFHLYGLANTFSDVCICTLLLDSLQDGALDATELRTGLEALLKQSVTPERAQQLLVALDTNGDGVRFAPKYIHIRSKLCSTINLQNAILSEFCQHFGTLLQRLA